MCRQIKKSLVALDEIVVSSERSPRYRAPKRAVCRSPSFDNRFVKRRVVGLSRTNRCGGMRLAGPRGEEMW